MAARFVVERDPDRDWRFITRDTSGVVPSQSFPSRRDAERKARELHARYRPWWPDEFKALRKFGPTQEGN